MPSIQPCGLPDGALLRAHRDAGAYTDCYATDIARAVSRAEYVEAFYTTPLFKAERLLLRWLASMPSTDAQARGLATDATGTFAAWHVEAREADQLLLCDPAGRTRSWLMVSPLDPRDPAAGTRLYFGSALVPVVDAATGRPRIPFPHRALMGFHKLYSLALLRAARARLARVRIESRG